MLVSMNNKNLHDVLNRLIWSLIGLWSICLKGFQLDYFELLEVKFNVIISDISNLHDTYYINGFMLDE